jgi:hypothetical protein
MNNIENRNAGGVINDRCLNARRVESDPDDPGTCSLQLWVPNRSSRSCGLGIFMDQSTESVATPEVQVGL